MKIDDVKAFILDDEDTVVSLVSRVLNLVGVRNIDTAPNQDEALELLSRNPIKPYNLFVFDTDAPIKGSGPKVLEKSRDIGYTPDLVIALSGIEENRSLWTGKSEVHYFVKKPFDINEFREIIKSHFE